MFGDSSFGWTFGAVVNSLNSELNVINFIAISCKRLHMMIIEILDIGVEKNKC